MKQRAYSSTGRTQLHFSKLQEMEEVEAIQNGLQRFEIRMQKATERREQEILDLKTNMKNLTKTVNEKLEFKNAKIENDYQAEFEKNVLKRSKMEEKKKKQQENQYNLLEFDKEKKEEKLDMVRRRQQDRIEQQAKQNKKLEQTWEKRKKRQQGMTEGQAAFYESMAAK